MHKASSVSGSSSSAFRWIIISIMAGLCVLAFHYFQSSSALREENRQLRERLAALEQAQIAGSQLQDTAKELQQARQFDSYKIQQLEDEVAKLGQFSNQVYSLKMTTSRQQTMMFQLHTEISGLKLMKERLEDELSGKPRVPPLGGWLGLNVTPATKENNYPKSDNGVVVTSMIENSPAERSMLRMRDVILSVDGEPVSDAKTLKSVMAQKDVGKEVVMDVLRTDGIVKIAIAPAGWPQ
jgi:C-terminal processing protease CtpA/Prc